MITPAQIVARWARSTRVDDRRAAEAGARLAELLGDVELSEQSAKFLEWMLGWDVFTIDAFARLLIETRGDGPLPLAVFEQVHEARLEREVSTS